MFKSFFKFLFRLFLVLFLLGSAAGLSLAIYLYIHITKDLPKIDSMEDYRPKAVTSVYSKDGVLMAELFDEQRYPVRFDEISPLIKNAFLAAEDASFYQHPGINFLSILRAVYVNFRHKASKQGASTITQQVVKSLLLSREKTYERKIKEAILSYRLEKRLTKDEIFSIYLNQIYLGSGSYGVKAAARVHFHKELNDLSIPEAAFIAGLPQKPSEYMKPENRAEAMIRQHYVLDQMLKNGMITAEQAKTARDTKITIYPQSAQRYYAAPYYASQVSKDLDEIFPTLENAGSPIDPGGYVIKTAANVGATKIAEHALQAGLRDVDKRRGWRGPKKNLASGNIDSASPSANEPIEKLEPGELYPATIKAVDVKANSVRVTVGPFTGTVDFSKEKWANTFLEPTDTRHATNPITLVHAGDSIEVSLPDDQKQPIVQNEETAQNEIRFRLDQTPQMEAALVTKNALTGEVEVILGGYDYRRSIFNRATQGLLQPGSSFKPIIYLAALSELHYTPATIVNDAPVTLRAGNGQLWTPGNYEGTFLGPITLRIALQKSRNVISVRLISALGADRVIKFARLLGLTTPIPRELSISLGTAEVRLIEMVGAYGVFAAGGWLADPITVSEIKDRDGKIIYRKLPKQKQVISEDLAFIMANMMKGVVERGTATVVKALNKPAAGKTGTTSDFMDAWFIGYTPEWVTGVWTGFDVKRKIGPKETGGRVAAPIFLNFMKEFLKDTPPLDFDIPDGVIPVPINYNSGTLASPDDPSAFIEYFISGTEPGSGSNVNTQQDYLSNSDF